MKGFIVGCLLLVAFVTFVVIRPLAQEATADEAFVRHAKIGLHKDYPRITIDDIRERIYGGHEIVYRPVGSYHTVCSAPVTQIGGSYQIEVATLRPPCTNLK